MSNKKKRLVTETEKGIILTEDNKFEVANLFGYEIPDLDLALVTARLRGYKAVRLPGPFTEDIANDPRFKALQDQVEVNK